MAAKMWVRYGLVLVIFCAMVLTSCAGKTGNADLATEQELAEQQRLDEVERLAVEEEVKQEEEARIETERLAMEKVEEEQKVQAQADFLDTNVYFGFDSFALTAESMEVLDVKAVWLSTNLNAKVTMEGHCDDRGTREYNLALGDRRAQTAKKYLVDSGIAEDRIATISYGEERPLDTAKNSVAWAKNRRAQVVLQ